MVKRLKEVLPSIIAASFVFFIGVIVLVKIYEKKKHTLTERTGLIKESVINENGESTLLDDFPVYPGASVESSFTSEGDKKATSVVWKTDDDISEVSSFYKQELEKTGWIVTSNIENDLSTTFSFEMDNKFGFIGIGEGEGSSTVISVTIGSR